jgi:ketosteroid isomerase-like protein
MTSAALRHVVMLAAVLVSLPAYVSAQSRESQVTAVLDSFYGAMKTGDKSAAMRVIAPDAVFVESGTLETRAQYETNHLPADIEFERQVDGKRSPWRVVFHGDAAWVIATTEYQGTFDKSPVNFVSAQLAVLTRDSENWLIRSIHWSSRRR